VHAAVHGNPAEEAHDSRFLCKAFEKVRARMRCCSRAITSFPQVSSAFSLPALICVHACNLQPDKVNCCCATPLFPFSLFLGNSRETRDRRTELQGVSGLELWRINDSYPLLWSCCSSSSASFVAGFLSSAACCSS